MQELQAATAAVLAEKRLWDVDRLVEEAEQRFYGLVVSAETFFEFDALAFATLNDFQT